MPGTSRKARTFEVQVSFNALDKGERFTADDADGLAWADQHVESGYLRDVTEEGSNVRGEDDKG